MKMVQICIIGAGFSGICSAVRLQCEIKSQCEITIYDENHDFGGVWLKNTYPNCETDIPAHLYAFSFEPNPDWSEAYCSQPEILAYLQNVADKHNLYPLAKFNLKVLELVWNETKLKWNVKVQNIASLAEKQLDFDFVISGQGRFTSPEIPREFKNFEGPIIHSGNWDANVKMEGKIVAVVGNGGSGDQIIPAIAGKVNRLVVIQRHASWVISKMQFRYPSIAKLAFQWIPGLMRIYRSCLKTIFEFRSSEFRVGTVASRIATSLGTSNITKQVKLEPVQKLLTPDYPFGCKSVVLSNDYYSTFNRENVTLIHGKIEKVAKDGIIMADGVRENVDIIVLATGFQVLNYCDGLNLTGKDDVKMLDLWKEDKPKSYLGIMNSHAPNFFVLLGPNVSTGYTSIILQLESQMNWIIAALNEMTSQKKKSICVKSSAEDGYMKEIAEKMKNMIYVSKECGESNSHYLNSRKDVIEIYPDSVASYEKITRNIHKQDFDFI